jgi:transcription-repair coupling factor (superfamily II helicase)
LLPEQGKNLFKLTEMRLRAQQLDIRKMDIGEAGGTIEFFDEPVVDPAVIFAMIQASPHRYKFSGPNTFKISDDLTDPADRMDRMDKLLGALHETVEQPQD